MDNKEILKIYRDLSKKNDTLIQQLYYAYCLQCSGFNETEAIDLIDLLDNLYLKDESGASIGQLSDYLYDYIKEQEADYKTKSPREILSDIRFYYDLDEDDYDEDYED